MALISGLTAERMLEIEAAAVVSGVVVVDNLILSKHNGTTVDVGSVRGARGITGDKGDTGPSGANGFAVRAKPSVSFGVSNNTATYLPLDTEDFDQGASHDTSSTTSRLTCVQAGIYLAIAQLEFASSSVGLRTVTVVRDRLYNAAMATLPAASGDNTRIQAVGLVALTAGDYLEVNAYQNSGGTLNVLAPNTFLSMVKVS